MNTCEHKIVRPGSLKAWEDMEEKMKQTKLPFVITSLLALVVVLGIAKTSRETAQSAAPFKPKCGAWSIVPTPGAGGLNAVSAVSTNDVWAVGAQILHWDGTQWSIVDSHPTDSLFGVTALSSHNVWVVGEDGVIGHWNGKRWGYIQIYASRLSAVAADAPNDVWAVGYIYPYHGYTQVIERWNGKYWSTPNYPGGFSSASYGVTALSRNNIWFVGSLNPSPGNPFIENWDGHNWNIAPNQNIVGQLNAVTYIPHTTMLWAVGITKDKSGVQTLVEQNTSTTWSIIPTPHQGFYSSALNAVAASDTSHVWAVGTYYSDSQTSNALIEFYC